MVQKQPVLLNNGCALSLILTFLVGRGICAENHAKTRSRMTSKFRFIIASWSRSNHFLISGHAAFFLTGIRRLKMDFDLAY